MIGISRRKMLAGAGALAAAGLGLPGANAAAGPGRGVAGLPPRRELIVRGGIVITMDSAAGHPAEADLHVRDGVIVAIGKDLSAPGAEIIDARSAVVLPGLIDTHWHFWNSLLRGLVGDRPGNAYFKIVSHLALAYTPEDTYQATLLTLALALNSGITTVHNWDHNLRGPDHAAASLRAHDEVGLRARFGYGTPQGLAPDKLMDLDDLARLKAERFAGPEKGLLTLGAALRGPQFGSMDACRRECEAVRELGLPIALHVTGNKAMFEKLDTVAALARENLLGPDVLLVHAVHSSAQDLEMIASTGTHVSLSPLTEMGAGMGFPPVAQMVAAGVPVSLSVDTIALPTIPDMFEIIRTAMNIAHASDEDAYKFTAEDALRLATVNGARNLGIDDQVGSLAPGKRADLIVVRLSDINLATTTDTIVNRVVKSARTGDVDTVVVDGRILKRGGRLTALDLDEIAADATAAVVSLRARAG